MSKTEQIRYPATVLKKKTKFSSLLKIHTSIVSMWPGCLIYVDSIDSEKLFTCRQKKVIIYIGKFSRGKTPLFLKRFIKNQLFYTEECSIPNLKERKDAHSTSSKQMRWKAKQRTNNKCKGATKNQWNWKRWRPTHHRISEDSL